MEIKNEFTFIEIPFERRKKKVKEEEQSIESPPEIDKVKEGPLTPVEQAIEHALVELWQDCHGYTVKGARTETIGGKEYIILRGLEHNDFLVYVVKNGEVKYLEWVDDWPETILHEAKVYKKKQYSKKPKIVTGNHDDRIKEYPVQPY